jgi:NAD(P)-dependent dehydrogenase (short-subunit alcohol dehydrogenase family)
VVWAGTNAEAVLESSDRLVATPRDPRRLDDLVNKFGERVRVVSLDVADDSAAQVAVQVALDAFVRLDVVVYNAGFGDIAPFGQLSAERFRAVIDTQQLLRSKEGYIRATPGYTRLHQILNARSFQSGFAQVSLPDGPSFLTIPPNTTDVQTPEFAEQSVKLVAADPLGSRPTHCCASFYPAF